MSLFDRVLVERAAAAKAAGFASLSDEQRKALADAWDRWRSRPSWSKRGQNAWYDCPRVKAALDLKPGDKVPSFIKRLKRKGLNEDALAEYGGMGGRIAGGRHPYRVPPSNTLPPANTIVTRKDMTPELLAKRQRELQQRAETRERMRQLAIESRRPLKTLGEAGDLGGGIKVGSRVKFPNEVGKLASGAWEIDSLGGPGGKVILYRVGKKGKTLSAMSPGKNLTGVPINRFREMIRAGDAVRV